MNRIYFTLLFFVAISCKTDAVKEELTSSDPVVVFSKIGSEVSGINFSNKLKEDVATKENVFDYDYFYNGSGVGVADINNDGLQDIVFTANQVDNRIYLNKGDLKFEDITNTSGINQGKGWSTGVTFVDINNDGWLDIYISQGGPEEGKDRKNLLLVNQQDLTFKEEAKKYGLDDSSISSQAAFFDFDKDGDLDCIVMNENTLYGTDPATFYSILSKDKDLLHQSSSHLYRNDDGHFVDITEASGLLKPTFGLGLIVSDINKDNWLDIYIANDYYVPDALYINNGQGGFDDEIKSFTDQVSFFGMGVDIADVNNDTNQEIFVLDMASADHYRAKTLMASMDTKSFDLLVNQLDLHHQYMFNSFQLNLGDGHYKNIAQLAKLSKTDWSWAVLMSDLNNSGYKDIYVTNGYRKYALDNDTRTKVLQAKRQYKGNVPLEVKERLYQDMPSEKLSNLIYQNKGGLAFDEVSQNWGIDNPSFSNGAAYADLDNDGDLELIVNNIDEEAFLYKNWSAENNAGGFLKVRIKGLLSESFAKVTIIHNGVKQLIECNRVKGYLSSMNHSAHFGLGDADQVDTIRVEWLSGKYEERYNIAKNTSLVFDEMNATLTTKEMPFNNGIFQSLDAHEIGLEFVHKENDFDDFEIETLLPYKQSTLGPFITTGDINGDGLEDLYIGGAMGQSGSLYMQRADRKFQLIPTPAIESDARSEDMEAVFFDIDNDGDSDLFVVSGGYEFVNGAEEYQDRLYINDGTGRFAKSIDPTLKDNRYSGKSIAIIDYDKDGLKDIVIGNRVVPGNYPKSPGSVIYRNTGNSLEDVTSEVIPDLSNFGMVNKVISTDFDQDGWQDLIVAGEWTTIGLFKNDKGKFSDLSADNNLNLDRGWWFTIEETDVNKDGLPDYVIGNVGMNTKYKASLETPFKIFADDFDDNGTWDIVLSNKYKDKYVPLRGKQCSSEQMPFIAKKFPTYDKFAKASLVDVYGDKLSNAYQREATEFNSIMLINKGAGKFEKKKLPIEAQLSPMLTCKSIDVNKDGYLDLIIAGNIYNTEVETPRFDAGSGLLLLADGDGDYIPQSVPQSGLYVDGNIKSSVNIKVGDVNYMLFGENNAGIKLFSY